MNQTIKTFKQCAAAAAVFCVMATGAQAAVTATQGLGSSWIGTPTISLAASPTSFAVAENSYGTIPSLSQSFLVSSSGTLDSLQLYVSGSAVTSAIHFYDLGTGANPSSYTPGSGGVSADMFSGISFTYNGGSASVLQLDLTGVDEISLAAGHRYAFEIVPSATGLMTWYRGGDIYAGGSAYRDRSLLNGVERDMSLAVLITPIPEPSAFALVGMGLAALMIFRRSRV